MNAVKLAVLSCLGFALVASASYDCRWVFAIDYLGTDVELSQAKALVTRAKAAGYTGLAVISGKDFTAWTNSDAENDGSMEYRSASTGLEDVRHMRPDRLGRFKALKAHCDASGMDFIPLVWSTGYCSMQYADANFAAVWKASAMPYVVAGGKAAFAPDPVVADLSKLDFDVDLSKPGPRERDVRLPVKPERKYRVTAKMRTSWLRKSPNPGPYGPGFKVLSPLVRASAESSYCPHLPATTEDYREVGFTFHTLPGEQYVTLREYCCVDTEGCVSFRDVRVEELGVEYPIRRAGTSFVVRDAATGRVFREGVDYARVPSTTTLRYVRREPAFELEILPGGAIADGARLLVDDFEAKCVNGDQFGACFTNPELLSFYRRSADDLFRELGVTKWFLSADEIRVGCYCTNCMARAESEGILFGRHFKAQYDAVKAVCPNGELFMWPDMADVNHNATAKPAYLLRTAPLGALDFIPKDVTMVCWWGGPKARIIAPYFTARGYRTMAAGFYDAKTPEKTREKALDWTMVLNATPGARGIIYTTWNYGIGANHAFLEDYIDAFRSAAAPYRADFAAPVPSRAVGCDLGNGDADLEKTAARLLAERPDVAVLQDVDNYSTRAGRVDQTAELARLTGLHGVFGPAAKLPGGQGEGATGAAVLSKAKPVSYHAYPLNGAQDADILFECAFPEWDLVTFRLPDDDKRAAALARAAVERYGRADRPTLVYWSSSAKPPAEAVEALDAAFQTLSAAPRGAVMAASRHVGAFAGTSATVVESVKKHGKSQEEASK